MWFMSLLDLAFSNYFNSKWFRFVFVSFEMGVMRRQVSPDVLIRTYFREALSCYEIILTLRVHGVILSSITEKDLCSF